MWYTQKTEHYTAIKKKYIGDTCYIMNKFPNCYAKRRSQQKDIQYIIYIKLEKL